MLISSRGYHVPITDLLRTAAAAAGAVMAGSWIVLLILEAVRAGEWIPNIYSWGQAVVLAVVFASYAIGWRHTLIGAALALAGTAIFFSVGYAGTYVMPPTAAAWLAAPGMLYLAAWFTGRRHDFKTGI